MAKARKRSRSSRPGSKPKPRAKRVAISWEAVAAAAGIDVRRLFRLQYVDGAPKTRDPAEWRAFAAAQAVASVAAAKTKSPAELAKEAADLRYAEARARREERSDQIEAGNLMTREQAQAAADGVRDAFVVEGEGMAAAVLALVPDLGKTEKQAVEDAVRAAWLAARNRITQGTARG